MPSFWRRKSLSWFAAIEQAIRGAERAASLDESVYGVGLGATAGGRFQLLSRLFETKIDLESTVRTTEGLLAEVAFSTIDWRFWSSLTAPRASFVAINDRLLDIFKREVPELAGSSADYEDLFERFEVLGALSFGHQTFPATFNANQVRFSIGRFMLGRRYKGYVRAWLAEAEAQGEQWPPIAGGLFGGSFARFGQLQAALAFQIQRTGW